MSVLVKGMKMPQTCTMCWLSPICPVWVKEVSRHKGYDDRLPDCPLVEVGRMSDLIDRQELIDWVNYQIDRVSDCRVGTETFKDGLMDGYCRVRSKVKELTPAIIEAEEGTDHE